MAIPRTIRLGDVEVPRIGLGTNRLAHTGENDTFVQEAVVAGLRHIDTAHTYVRGQSEATIGEALASDRDGVVVATKGGWDSGRPEAIREQIEERLRLLRRSPAMLPIPGTLSLEHLRENLDALEIELSDAEFEALS